MAVTFRKGPKTLLNDLKKRGYQIASVHNAEGNPARSIQIYLKEGLVINWDRDSRSVWAEGPWPQAHKAEVYLKGIYEGNWLRRTVARNRTAFLLVVIVLVVVAIGSRVFAPDTPPLKDPNPPPPASALADESSPPP